MYSIKVEAQFSAAHNLRGYKGKCEELHGHNWKIEAVLARETLDNTGMVADFKYLKGKLNKAIEKLDHAYLNKIAYFKKVNPTSENIAAYIYRSLKSQLADLKSITVWENTTSSATYEQ